MRREPTTTDELLKNFVAAATMIAAVAAITFGVMMLRGLIAL
jgi:hypothetical protein